MSIIKKRFQSKILMSTTIHLVRHGRIPDYQTDRPLTTAGAEEALAAGRQLAAIIQPGEAVRFYSSPARRARQTAALLRDGLRQVLADSPSTITIRETAAVDDRLQNNLMYVGGAAYDPITPLVEVARWRLHKTPSPENEACLNFQLSFWQAADPVAFWLSTPSQFAEPPQAVVTRTRALIKELLDKSPPGRYICVTHSANLRAFLQVAFGRDPGSPPFSGMLTIHNGKVEYQDQSGPIDLTGIP